MNRISKYTFQERETRITFAEGFRPHVGGPQVAHPGGGFRFLPPRRVLLASLLRGVHQSTHHLNPFDPKRDSPDPQCNFKDSEIRDVVNPEVKPRERNHSRSFRNARGSSIVRLDGSARGLDGRISFHSELPLTCPSALNGGLGNVVLPPPPGAKRVDGTYEWIGSPATKKTTTTNHKTLRKITKSVAPL